MKEIFLGNSLRNTPEEQAQHWVVPFLSKVGWRAVWGVLNGSFYKSRRLDFLATMSGKIVCLQNNRAARLEAESFFCVPEHLILRKDLIVSVLSY